MPSSQLTTLSVQQLDAGTRREVESLVALCKRHEPIELALLLDPEPSPEHGQNLYFLCHLGDPNGEKALVGAASTWPGREVEAVGAVHPGYRRQGIGRALFDALIQEARQRGADSMHLVCEENAPSGAAFARAVGAQYEFSEYRMELDRTRYAGRPNSVQTIALERADQASQDTLVALLSTSREVNPPTAQALLQNWLSDAAQRLYVGWQEDRAIGVIRVHQGHSSAHLYSFVVHPDLRGCGYGRQILMGILDELIAEDWPHIMLEVDVENVVALSLYRSVGFEPITVCQYYHLAVQPPMQRKSKRV
jgi:ribosomal protein S18 acetylase RimI-like enzyme